jgi:hypothetical protein
MTRIAVSRRNLLEAGACVLTGAVGLPGVAKRAPMDRAEQAQRGDHPEVLRSVGEERLGPIRWTAGRQLHLYQPERRRPHQ